MWIDDLKPVIGRLPGYLRLLWALSRESRLGVLHKSLLAAGALYSLSPIDLVPGFIPVVGQLDDLLVLLSVIRKALRALPEGMRGNYLDAQGLTMEQLEADQRAVMQAAADISRTAGRAAVTGAKGVAGWGARAGRAVMRALKKYRGF